MAHGFRVKQKRDGGNFGPVEHATAAAKGSIGTFLARFGRVLTRFLRSWSDLGGTKLRGKFPGFMQFGREKLSESMDVYSRVLPGKKAE
jgi:hypothetical protein